MSERERVAEIVREEVAGRRWCDICESYEHECGCTPSVTDVGVEAAAARIHAIYTEGLEPVAWRHKTPHGWVVTKTKTQGQSVPLYTHPPRSEAEARLRKALEEIAAVLDRVRQGLEGHGLEAVDAIVLRALSDTEDG